MTQANLAKNATAQLMMNHGNPCSIAEFALFLEQYGYSQDPSDPHRFIFMDTDIPNAAAAPCSIVLQDLSAPIESMDIFGQDAEHFTNLNYLMQKAGWTGCAVVSIDDDVAAKLLARLVSVEVTGTAVDMPASSFRAAAEPADVQSNVPPQPVAAQAPDISNKGKSTSPASTALNSLEESHVRVREMTIKCNALEEQVADLQSSNAALEMRNEEMTRQLQEAQKLAATAHNQQGKATARDPQPAADGLLRIVEKHLLPKIDTSNYGSAEVVQELRAIGFDVHVQLRLVKTS